MKPKEQVRQAQRELFHVELEQLVDATHPLVKLGQQLDWAVFTERLGQTYASKQGAPGVNTRLLVALHSSSSSCYLNQQGVGQFLTGVSGSVLRGR